MNQADDPDEYLLLPKETAHVKPLTSRIKVTLLAPKRGCGAFHTPDCEYSFAG